MDSAQRLSRNELLGEFVGRVKAVSDADAEAREGALGFLHHDKLFDLPHVNFSEEEDPKWLVVDCGDGGNDLAYINDIEGFPDDAVNTWPVRFSM